MNKALMVAVPRQKKKCTILIIDSLVLEDYRDKADRFKWDVDIAHYTDIIPFEFVLIFAKHEAFSSGREGSSHSSIHDHSSIDKSLFFFCFVFFLFCLFFSSVHMFRYLQVAYSILPVLSTLSVTVWLKISCSNNF